MEFIRKMLRPGWLLLLTATITGCASQCPAPPAEVTRTADVHLRGQPAVRPGAVRMPDTRVARGDAGTHCLALAMYWEARGEGRVGMQAVGEVVLNRMADPRFPETMCGVVKQGGETPPCQFSWWCDGRSDYPSDRVRWRQALDLARDMSQRRSSDITRGALFFHSASVRPNWKFQRVARIGNHVFYR